MEIRFELTKPVELVQDLLTLQLFEAVPPHGEHPHQVSLCGEFLWSSQRMDVESEGQI